MTASLITDTVADIADAVRPDRDQVLREMDDRANREGFPTVGPQVGGWLTLLARAVDAEAVFEFGSGFGYSAYWFARALPADGEVVLTEIDRDELDAAREYFERGGLADCARFEHGDAIDIVEGYDGPFDVVLLDNEKERYVEAFEAVRGKLRSGSLVLADNAVTAGVIDTEDLAAILSGETCAASDATAGIAEYLTHVRDAEEFETTLLPMGEGVAISVRL
jgi:predicted O-methyltransferase YrrM